MKTVLCDKCGIVFTRLDNFKRHFNHQHKENVNLFQCMFCDKVFKRRENLRRHFHNRHYDYDEQFINGFDLCF